MSDELFYILGIIPYQKILQMAKYVEPRLLLVAIKETQ
jgi:hypothetical protein